jgi:small redox-active disulfide protein 2
MTIRIKVFGPGSVRCQTLFENAKAAVQELGIDAEVEKVDDVAEMVMRGIMASPALPVNEKLVLAGHIATPRRLGELISEAT